jgi:hypothetical protein
MSRIDDAFKRLAGVVSAEPRTTSMLDRYASEGAPSVEKARHAHWAQEPKITKFSPPAPAARPNDARPAPASAPAAPQAQVTSYAEPKPEPEVTEDTAPLINVRRIVDYTGFVARSVRRHKLMAASTVGMVMALTIAAVLVLPKTYHVETKLFAQRNAVMAALSNPGRAVPWDADAPTKAAAETVLRRDNLIALITQTDLINEWERRRARVLRMKDWTYQKVTRYTPDADDKLEALIGLLEARMDVEAGPVGDGTVTIKLDWPDAEMGYRLVQAAQQAFLEARQLAETAAIGESIAILERYSTSLQQDINRTLAELEKTRPKTGAAPSRVFRASRGPLAAAVPTIAASLGVPQLAESLETDPEMNRLKSTLGIKRRDLSTLETARQNQMHEAENKLAQLKTVYTASHPSVLTAQQNLAAASQDHPKALALAAEIEELQAEYDKRLADATDAQIKNELARRSAEAASAAVKGQAAAAVAPEPVAPPPVSVPSDLPTTSEFTTLRLRSELNQLESVLERTDGARIELAVSQAAFKYRYSVIRPAQVPRDPVAPNLQMVAAAGVVCSLLLALVVVVATDLLGNRILESWQIERQLGLPIIGTLRRA